MKVRKTFYFLFICSCCFVTLSGCSTGTAGPTPTSTPNGQTPVVSVTSMPPAQTSCPTGGKANPAIMTPMSPGSHANIVYISEHGGTQTIASQATLVRYDTITGSKTTILSFARPDTGITSAQISADGQWILYVATTLSENQAKLQLIRADGQGLQTLLCRNLNEISSIQWSPNQQTVAFIGPAGPGSAIYLLNLATGQLEQLIGGAYQPFAWLDNARLYVTQVQGDQNISQKNLYLIDTSKGVNQKPGNLVRIASVPAGCGGFEKSSDGTQMFASACLFDNFDNCRGYATQGPSTLSTMPAVGGSARTIYSSKEQALAAIHVVNSQTLLMYIENTDNNLSQNGLWKLNTDGSGLTRLTTAPGKECADLEFPTEWPQIISHGQSYALRISQEQGPFTALLVGSLNGGAQTTFATLNLSEGIMFLVGWAMM